MKISFRVKFIMIIILLFICAFLPPLLLLIIRYPVHSAFAIILLSTFFPFVLNKLNPDLTGYGNPLVLLICYLYCIILIMIYSLKKPSIIFNIIKSKVFLSTIFAIAFLFLLAIHRNLQYDIYINEFQNHLRALPIFLTLGFVGIRIKHLNYYVLLGLIVLAQSLVGIFSYFGPREIYLFFSNWTPYIWKGNFKVPVEDVIVYSGRLISGTMGRFNHYSNFLAAAIIYLFGSLAYIKSKSNRRFIEIIIILGIISVFLSGGRMGLISMLLGFCIIGWFRKRKITIAAILIMTILIILNMAILQSVGLQEMETSKSRTPFKRLLGSFGILTNPFEADSHITPLARYTSISPYFFHNPILGAGQYWISGYPNLYPGSRTLTDVTLGYLLVEFGIIGFLIYLFPILFILKVIVQKKGFVQSIPLLAMSAVLGCQTLADPGLFLGASSFLFFTISGLELAIRQNWKMPMMKNIRKK